MSMVVVELSGDIAAMPSGSMSTDEQGDVVELELLNRRSRRGDCGDGVEVTLDEPLGSRRVVDTATGEAPPLCESDGLPSC